MSSDIPLPPPIPADAPNLLQNNLRLTDLINSLNRNSATASSPTERVSSYLIEQGWADQLFEETLSEESLHLKAMGTLVDEIGRLKAKLSQIEQMVDQDTMCPVLNRRAFEREVQRAIAIAGRSDQDEGGSVLFLDMNGLKGINDRYGHNAGDRAIERLAKTLVLCARQVDLVARLGGDEFAALLPHTPIEGALVLGNRVSTLLANIPLMLEDGTSVTLSTSYGASAYNGDSTLEQVMDHADQAMYATRRGSKHTCYLVEITISTRRLLARFSIVLLSCTGLVSA
jgi:diguanylate cyclase (GGDEF)-like protein